MPHAIIDLCDGCSACASQCPTQAISGVFKGDYRIEPALCIDCGVCGAICVRDAVLDPAGLTASRVPRRDRPRPVVDESRCNGCGDCVDFCPFDCLRVSGRRYLGVAWLAEPFACVSCGDCVRVCIKGAMTLEPRDLNTPAPRPEPPTLEVSP